MDPDYKGSSTVARGRAAVPSENRTFWGWADSSGLPGIAFPALLSRGLPCRSLPSPAGITRLRSRRRSSRLQRPRREVALQTPLWLRSGPLLPDTWPTALTSLPTAVTKYWRRCYWQLFSKTEQNPKTIVLSGKIWPRTLLSLKPHQLL